MPLSVQHVEPAELEAIRRQRNWRRKTRRAHTDATHQLIAQAGRDRARAHARRRAAIYPTFERGLALLVRAIRKPVTGGILVAEYTGIAVRSRAGRVLVHRDPPAERAKRRKHGKRLRDRGLAWVPIGRTRPIDEYRGELVFSSPDVERRFGEVLSYEQSVVAVANMSRDYEREKAEFDRRFLAWREGGEVGDPPPRPVRPHTPGMMTPVDEFGAAR